MDRRKLPIISANGWLHECYRKNCKINGALPAFQLIRVNPLHCLAGVKPGLLPTCYLPKCVKETAC